MELDWTSAQPNVDEMRIALTPDSVWRDTFARVAAQWQRETRGQVWDDVQLDVDGRGIVVIGLAPETESHDLRVYLTSLVEAVDREAELTRQREAQQTAQSEQDAETQVAAVDRLATELRDQD